MLEPLGIGGESATVYDDNGITKVAFKGMPEKFQTGFRNYAGTAGLNCSAQMAQIQQSQAQFGCI